MSELPFTSEQFFQVFRNYNEQLWPVQLILLAIALAIVWLAIKGKRARLGWLGLGALWLWCGAAYHWLHFATVNPAAYAFGALFVAQGILLGVTAGRGVTGLVAARNTPGVLGDVLVAIALIVYPIIGFLAGHAYMASPTFGLPCPLTIFTFGVLLWAQPRVPMHLLLIPAVWAVVGSSAFLAFGVWQDVLLPLAGLVAIGVRLVGARRASVSQAAA